MKKFLLSALALVAVAALAITGTIAYLTWDDSDINVMTVGQAQIKQHEKERVDMTYQSQTEKAELKDWEPSALYPAVWNKEGKAANDPICWAPGGAAGAPENHYVNYGDFVTADVAEGSSAWNGIWDTSLKNVKDKMVFVENTGDVDVYYRTIILFEYDETETTNEYGQPMIHYNYNGNDRFEWTKGKDDYNLKTIEVNGEVYSFVVATYRMPLLPGTVSRPSLLQVGLDGDATNEIVEQFGETYDVLVLSQAVQTEGFANAEAALTAGFGEINEANLKEWFGDVIAEHSMDAWDGTADDTWYNENDTEFEITTAEQLAGLAELVDGGNTFEGKTIKLGRDLDLKVIGDNGEAICFDPIGSYRKDNAFKGTFDGQGNTIMNLSQNTWALDNGYNYKDLGLGLFGLVEDATVKNLTMDGASISGESAICGTIASCAYGDMLFENITVKNSKVNDYQYYAGGIVGWASGTHIYKNINMDASTIIGSQWGDFGNANGGIIGGIGSSAVILFEDCTIACRIDATNDVVSAYQWYNYRNSGMLVGKVPQTITNGEVQTVATPTNVTCKNVTVIYGDWANYTYCEFAGTGYPYVRVQAGVSVDAYSNVRYGHPTDANGNTVVDDNHVHNAGEAHHELIAFDQLFGGPADHRYCYYGISAYDGVTVVYNNK